ncbi:MAG: peptidoglycan DD-metalloendopeptidase family protein [Deltaproteobacteria bacterium]|nr:peptidoglycan DD-metalloendopeptidase family protein [Deltaproteobacteria bacterium]
MVQPTARVIDVTLGTGETLGSVLSGFGLDASAARAVGESLRPFVKPQEIRSGKRLRVIVDAKEGIMQGLEYPLREAVLSVTSTPEGWSAERREIPSARVTRVVRGVVSRSLYRDGTAAGLTAAQILELADIFQYEVDFFSDFRRGDTFSVAFEEIRYVDGRREPAKIQAAEVTAGGVPVHAFRHTTEEGEDGYFDNDGRSLRRAFLRAPLNYRRISSHYSVRRMHPILRTVRPHLAIDYAAAAGTPVVCVGRGTVKFTGWHEGYGNLVEVAHGNGYSTRYGHLSRIPPGLRRGDRVAQGDVIGYVGQTGHATGPHLHFEMIQGQRKINFLALRIPSQQQLAGEDLGRFTELRDRHLFLLSDAEFRVAQNPS